MEVTYTLENAALTIDYRAVSDKTTVVNLTNHTYFNLAGHDSGPVDGQILTLAADRYTPCGPGNIPTGALASVAGTPLDLRSPARLGDRLDHPFLAGTRGFDHNFVLRNPATGPAAVLSSPETGVALELGTGLYRRFSGGAEGERWCPLRSPPCRMPGNPVFSRCSQPTELSIAGPAGGRDLPPAHRLPFSHRAISPGWDFPQNRFSCLKSYLLGGIIGEKKEGVP